jgi:hypothetical protein
MGAARTRTHRARARPLIPDAMVSYRILADAMVDDGGQSRSMEARADDARNGPSRRPAIARAGDLVDQFSRRRSRRPDVCSATETSICRPAVRRSGSSPAPGGDADRPAVPTAATWSTSVMTLAIAGVMTHLEAAGGGGDRRRPARPAARAAAAG